MIPSAVLKITVHGEHHGLTSVRERTFHASGAKVRVSVQDDGTAISGETTVVARRIEHTVTGGRNLLPSRLRQSQLVEPRP